MLIPFLQFNLNYIDARISCFLINSTLVLDFKMMNIHILDSSIDYYYENQFLSQYQEGFLSFNPTKIKCEKMNLLYNYIKPNQNYELFENSWNYKGTKFELQCLENITSLLVHDLKITCSNFIEILNTKTNRSLRITKEKKFMLNVIRHHQHHFMETLANGFRKMDQHLNRIGTDFIDLVPELNVTYSVYQGYAIIQCNSNYLVQDNVSINGFTIPNLIPLKLNESKFNFEENWSKFGDTKFKFYKNYFEATTDEKDGVSYSVQAEFDKMQLNYTVMW